MFTWVRLIWNPRCLDLFTSFVWSYSFSAYEWGIMRQHVCASITSLFLSPPYTLSLKWMGDKVIMLCFSVRQEPFAVMGLLNVFLLRWGLCALEPQWTELLTRKIEKCSFWTTCSMNHLSCGNRVICISPATAGGLLMNPGMTDCLERSRVGPDLASFSFMSRNYNWIGHVSQDVELEFESEWQEDKCIELKSHKWRFFTS